MDERKSLPILRKALQIRKLLTQHRVLLLTGETGCGKSTEMPLLLRDYLHSSHPSSPKQKIAISQPRRVACSALAKYLAEREGLTLG